MVQEEAAWKLWIPTPEKPMKVETSGGVREMAVVDAPYGVMRSVTGAGNATLHYRSGERVLRLDPVGSGDIGLLQTELSAEKDMEGFCVWRGNRDEITIIQVLAHVRGGVAALGGGARSLQG
ncbi:MAG: hypothetical protein ACE5HJ_03425 [Thermoplasmata archaeon]